MKINKSYLYAAGLIMLLVSCKKETAIYEVNNEPVKLNTVEKNTLKRETEFISQAYADLFGKPIGSNALNQSLICYAAFSDKDMVQDLIIRDMIRDASY